MLENDLVEFLWKLMISYLYIVDVVAVPGGVEEFVSETHDENVLDHLLTEVVVDTEDLLFFPVGVESFLEVARALKVLAEGLLNLLRRDEVRMSKCPVRESSNEATYDNTGNAVLGIAVSLQLIRNGDEDARRQSHVEDSVLFLLPLLDILKVLRKVLERFVLVILPRDVGAELAEAVQLLLDLLRGGLNV